MAGGPLRPMITPTLTASCANAAKDHVAPNIAAAKIRLRTIGLLLRSVFDLFSSLARRKAGFPLFPECGGTFAEIFGLTEVVKRSGFEPKRLVLGQSH